MKKLALKELESLFAAIAAQQAGLALYEAGHYHTELPYRERLKAYLDTACPGVEFIVSESERPPMETL